VSSEISKGFSATIVVPAQVVNELLNQNWRTVSEVMIPETKKQWEPILVEICNKLFAQVPYRRLLKQE
jgi:hypothetical protein